MIDTRDFLEAVAGYSDQPVEGKPSAKDRPVKLGTVDQYYTAGLARVLFDGEPVMSLKGYAWDSAYTPVAGDRVYLIPVGQSYIISGKIQSTTPYARYFSLPMTNGWVDYDTINYQSGSFTKTVSGIVKLTGVIKNGNAANNALIATLPQGFRPAKRMIFAADSNGVAGTLTVDANGEVRVKQWINATWLSLSQVTFPTEILNWRDVTLLNGFTVGLDYQVGPPQFAIDAYKRVWFRGAAIKTGGNPAADTTMFVLPTEAKVGITHHVLMPTLDGSSNFGHGDFLPAGDVRWKTGSATTHMAFGGIMIPDVTNTWSSPTFQGGWLNYDAASFTPAGYYKDADGVVHVRGLVRSGAINSTIFNLPAGYRPSKTIIRENSSNQAMGRVDIFSSGNIIPVAGSNGWFSLDGISFTPEA